MTSVTSIKHFTSHYFMSHFYITLNLHHIAYICNESIFQSFTSWQFPKCVSTSWRHDFLLQRWIQFLSYLSIIYPELFCFRKIPWEFIFVVVNNLNIFASNFMKLDWKIINNSWFLIILCLFYKSPKTKQNKKHTKHKNTQNKCFKSKCLLKWQFLFFLHQNIHACTALTSMFSTILTLCFILTE